MPSLYLVGSLLVDLKNDVDHLRQTAAEIMAASPQFLKPV